MREVPLYKTSCGLAPITVELIPTLGALFPRGGPVQDPVLTLAAGRPGVPQFHLI
jgi:hypothetical protein